MKKKKEFQLDDLGNHQNFRVQYNNNGKVITKAMVQRLKRLVLAPWVTFWVDHYDLSADVRRVEEEIEVAELKVKTLKDKLARTNREAMTTLVQFEGPIFDDSTLVSRLKASKPKPDKAQVREVTTTLQQAPVQNQPKKQKAENNSNNNSNNN